MQPEPGATRQGTFEPGLPGAELLEQGLRDLTAGEETECAMIIAMAAPRLRALGVNVPSCAAADPAHRLYELLSDREPADAHSRYNALVRRITSLARAAEHAPTG